VAVAQSVEFACALKATEFVLVLFYSWKEELTKWGDFSSSEISLRRRYLVLCNRKDWAEATLCHPNSVVSRMASSEMLRRVALVRTDVSEELRASIIRVTRIGELGTTLAATCYLRLKFLLN
jgi:hypothetical protein